MGERTINKVIIILTAIISTVFYFHSWNDESYSAERKRIHESKKKSTKLKGGKGNLSKTVKQEPSTTNNEDQEKALGEIAPYNSNKTLVSGRHVSESQSRESRLHSTTRKKLLRLLKEKIDKGKINKTSSKFSKGDLKLLRKLDEIKKKLDDEEKRLQILIAEKELKKNELSQIISQKQIERNKITKLLEVKKNEDERKLIKLVTILEKVKPELLGPFLEEIDEDLFIAIIEKMKPKTFAKALKFISKDKAIKLNEKYLTR